MPGSWIGRNLLRTRHRIIRCPSGSRWYHVVVIAKREPALLVVVNQSSEVHTVIVATGLNPLFLSLTLVPIEVVRPSAGNALQRGSMVAHSSMHGGIAGDTLIQASSSKTQETALTATSHTQLLTIPRGVLLDIVYGTDTTQHHALVIALVTVIVAIVPIVHQCTIEDIVIHFLVHGHWDAMNANLQRDNTL